MKVKEVMTPEVVTVGPEMPFKEIIDCMARSELSCLPVIDQNRSLVGIITEADLISKEAYGTRRRRALALVSDLLSKRDHPWVAKAAGVRAADVMSKDVVVCRPRDDIRSVAKRMLERRVKRIPVMEDGRLVGIVSRHDVLAVLDRPDELIARDVERALVHDPDRPDDHHVRFSVRDGIVTLFGDARYAWDKPVVVSIVRGIPGVIDVDSRLHHREPKPRGLTTRAGCCLHGDHRSGAN